MNRIKDLREDMELTQGELGKSLGNIPQRTISGYETESAEPSKEVWINLADFFDVSLDYLMGKTNNPYNNNFIEGLTQDEIEELAHYKELLLNSKAYKKLQRKS